MARRPKAIMTRDPTAFPKPHKAMRVTLAMRLGRNRSRRRLPPEGAEPLEAWLCLGFLVSVQQGAAIHQHVMGKALVLSVFGGK